MKTKAVFWWSLFDFGNSITSIAIVLYFSQWLIVDHGVADVWYNLIFVASSALLLATSPFTSTIADKRKAKVSYLRTLTLLQYAFLLTSVGLACYCRTTVRIIGAVIVLYTVSNYFYQFALVFYNALLPDLSEGQNKGTVSGIGQFAKWSGNVAGIAITLPFAHATFSLLGNSGRSQTFLPATLVALLLVVPTVFLLKDRTVAAVHQIILSDELKAYFSHLQRLLQQPGIARFLISFFFFNDAILTIEHNMPVYMQRVLGMSDKMKSLVLAGGLGAAAIGGLIGATVSDRIGQKKSLIAVLIAWLILIPLLGTTTSAHLFFALALIMGLLLGMTWTVTRAVLAYLAPPDQVNHSFSYYSLAERFATFVGPLTWGLLVTSLSRYGSIRYRIALFAMGAFVLLGLVAASKIPSDRRSS